MSDDRKTSEQWHQKFYRVVVNREGWQDASISWQKLISFELFKKLADQSTTRDRRDSVALNKMGVSTEQWIHGDRVCEITFINGDAVSMKDVKDGTMIPTHTQSFRRFKDGNRGERFKRVAT